MGHVLAARTGAALPPSPSPYCHGKLSVNWASVCHGDFYFIVHTRTVVPPFLIYVPCLSANAACP